jgi:L-lactate dehydrogenase (cytochrome)
MIAANVQDFRDEARRRLPRFLFDYIDGGSYAERTLKQNTADFESIALRQRVLRDVSAIDLSAELFGTKAAMPLALAPVGLAGMFARRGEVQAARAAEAAGVPFCLSTVSGCALKEVQGAVRAPFWFQLYMIKDRGFMRELLQRAQDAGCTALFFTVDLAVPGARYRDIRNGLTGGAGLARAWQFLSHPRWLWDVGVRGRPHSLGNVASAMPPGSDLGDFWKWVGANFDASVTWKELDWIRETWNGPLVIKGVLDVEDAREAAKLGADGIVVSNHGGRQLDGALSGVMALPPIADAVGDKLTVLMDGGIRSGLDVVRALALGARGVLVGRAWAYALAADGGRGVARMLDILRQEMRVAMVLTGHRNIAEIDKSALAR